MFMLMELGILSQRTLFETVFPHLLAWKHWILMPCWDIFPLSMFVVTELGVLSQNMIFLKKETIV